MDSELRVLYLRDAALVYGGGLSYATSGSAGMDLRACPNCDNLRIAPGERACVPSGICIECPAGSAAFIYSRSGLGAVKGLTVAQGVGVVDADYRGEVMVWLLNTSREERVISRGERIAQLVIHPVLRPASKAVPALSPTTRGSGGFGHTGQQ